MCRKEAPSSCAMHALLPATSLTGSPANPFSAPRTPWSTCVACVVCTALWVGICAMLNPYVVPTLALSPWQVELPHSASKATVSRPGLQLRYGCVLAVLACGSDV